MRTLSDRFRWWAKRAPDTVLDFVYGVDTGSEIAGQRGPHAYDAAPLVDPEPSNAARLFARRRG